MNTMELIKARRSVRTFDGRQVATEDKEKLCAYIETIKNPQGIPVEFVLLDAKEHGLFSSVIAGETLYIAGKAPEGTHSEEAFGYSFEKMVLCAQSLGLGTTWIAGTLDRDLFNKAAGTKPGEIMYCVSPLGYPAKEMSAMETKFRKVLHADTRKPESELFFEGDFSTPLGEIKGELGEALEAVRLAPSATNTQPWRVVKTGDAFHFYEMHAKALAGHAAWDVQKIDMGIALCHFMSLAGGTLKEENPGLALPEDTEYIATVVFE